MSDPRIKPVPFGYRTSAFWYALGARIAIAAPRSLIRWAARRVGDWYGWTHPGVRRTVAHQLALADRARGDGRRTPVQRPFREFSETVADFLRLAGGRGDEIVAEIEVAGLEHLQRCQMEGAGVVFLSAHMGNWEAVGAWGASRGLRVLGVARPHPNPRVDEFFNAARRRFGLAVFPLGGDPRLLAEHLQGGGVVAIVGDRDFTGRGAEVAFLGARTRLPQGWIRLAQQTGAWILPGRHRRVVEDGRHVSRLEFREPWRVAPGEAGAAEAFARGSAFLEELIREDPGAWTVFDPVLQGGPPR
ncbi:MAG: lysophospholipid acyltransferase family protein [bacterium]|nr:lysophospholipid acyltransferase family protein [bacterium]